MGRCKFSLKKEENFMFCVHKYISMGGYFDDDKCVKCGSEYYEGWKCFGGGLWYRFCKLIHPIQNSNSVIDPERRKFLGLTSLQGLRNYYTDERFRKDFGDILANEFKKHPKINTVGLQNFGRDIGFKMPNGKVELQDASYHSKKCRDGICRCGVI